MEQKKNLEDIFSILQSEHGYTIRRTLGKGAFGEVFLVQKNGVLWAVKSISKLHVRKRPFLEKYIKQEIEAMRTLKHPNLVRQERIIQTQDYFFMVLEYCDGGNLLTYQSKLKTKTFPLAEALEIFVQVLKGLKVVHENNYIHRDIKSENVLIKLGQRGNSYKIADFGFARPIKSGSARTVCGTEKYMAPEILQNIPYNISVDLWAVGILLYFMLFAEYPFKGFDILADIKKKCAGGFNLRQVVSRKEKIKQSNPELQDFFKRIFVVDYRKRMTFSRMISHPLLRNFQKQFNQSNIFYTKMEGGDVPIVQPEPPEEDEQQYVELVPDEIRSGFIGRQVHINKNNIQFQREIEHVSFQVAKIIYLRECSNIFFQDYNQYIPMMERLAIRYYVLRAFLFYSEGLLMALESKQIPQELQQYKFERWRQFADSKEYVAIIQPLKLENMLGRQQFSDTYEQLKPHISSIRIKNFADKFTANIPETEFEQFKVAYRSTTSYVFKLVHENKTIDSHQKNKIKMRLFCCHMINRIFDPQEVDTNFQYYVKWLQKNNLPNDKFDFVHFRQWMLSQTKDNLDKNIILLHKIFFSK